jgi:hypothetical protein
MNIEELKKLAGITNEFKGYKPYEENISVTGTEKRRIEKERGIKPGDPDWFKLWFSLPHMTGPVQFRGRKK